MNIEKGTIMGSPFVGIYGTVTNKFGIFPNFLPKSKIDSLENLFNVQIIQTSIIASTLVGVLSSGYDNKFLIPQMTEKKEKKTLEKSGVEFIELKETGIGNLISISKKAILVGTNFPNKEIEKIEDFLKIKVYKQDLNNSEIVGSNVVVTDNGFIANPIFTDEEFIELENLFELAGVATTANFGDPHVSNSVLANKYGFFAGNNSTGPEMQHIDEALSKDIKKEGAEE